MVDRGEQERAFLHQLPVFLRDPVVRMDQAHGGDAAEADDDLRADQLHLLPEVPDAGVLLLGKRVPVAGRTAFENVRDVDLVTRDADGLEVLVEQLSRRADERDPGPVLLLARRFPDEHQRRRAAARSEHKIRPGLPERAAVTRRALRFEFTPLHPSPP